jgi:hypothetical protein
MAFSESRSISTCTSKPILLIFGTDLGDSRLFVLLSGLAHITLPTSSDDAWIVEGLNPLVVAVDTTGIGHYTTYPSDKETIALQFPFAEGKIPAHKVLKDGACHSASQMGQHPFVKVLAEDL